MDNEKQISLSARLPIGMKDFINKKAKETPYRNANNMLRNLLRDFLENPESFPLTKDDILKFENLEMDIKDYTFKAEMSLKEKVDAEALGSLRSGREYTKKFIYSVYNKLITNS